MPKELATNSVESLKKDKVIFAIDRSGSTKTCSMYWDTVSDLIERNANVFNEQSDVIDVQYIFWSSNYYPCELYDKKEQALDFIQQIQKEPDEFDWGGTEPSVFIPLLKSQEEKNYTLILITDGGINYSSEVQCCLNLLKNQQIEFERVDAYFLGVPKSMDLTVFAPFATALKQDAAWNLYLNGAKNSGVVFENLNKYSADFDSFSSDFLAIKNYAEMETFKWRIKHEESDVQSNPCFQAFEELKENFVSKIKGDTNTDLQATEETIKAYFKALLTFKERNEIKTSDFTMLCKELEELVANSGKKIQKIIKNREQLTIEKIKNYCDKIIKNNDEIEKLMATRQKEEEEETIQQPANEHFHKDSSYYSHELHRFNPALLTIDTIEKLIESNLVLEKRMNKLIFSENEVHSKINNLRHLAEELAKTCNEEKKTHEEKISSLEERDSASKGSRNECKSKYYLTPANKAIAAYDKFFSKINTIKQLLELLVEDSIPEDSKRKFEKSIKQIEELISSRQEDNKAIASSLKERNNKLYIPVINKLQTIIAHVLNITDITKNLALIPDNSSGALENSMWRLIQDEQSSQKQFTESGQAIRKYLNAVYFAYFSGVGGIEERGRAKIKELPALKKEAHEATSKIIEYTKDDSETILNNLEQAILAILQENWESYNKNQEKQISYLRKIEEEFSEAKNQDIFKKRMPEIDNIITEMAKTEKELINNVIKWDHNTIQEVENVFKEIFKICCSKLTFGFERFFPRQQQAGFTQTAECPIMLDEAIPVLLINKRGEPILSNLNKVEQRKFILNPSSSLLNELKIDDLKERIKDRIGHFVGLEFAKKSFENKEKAARSPNTQEELIGYLAIDNHNRSDLAEKTQRTLGELFIGPDNGLWNKIPYRKWLSVLRPLLEEISYFEDNELAATFFDGIKKYCDKYCGNRLDPYSEFSSDIQAWLHVEVNPWRVSWDNENRLNYEEYIQELDELAYPYDKEQASQQLFYYRILSWIIQEKKANSSNFSQWLRSFYQDAIFLNKRYFFDGDSPLSRDFLVSIRFFYGASEIDEVRELCLYFSHDASEQEKEYLDSVILPKEGYRASVRLNNDYPSTSHSLSFVELLSLVKLVKSKKDVYIPTKIQGQTIPQSKVNYGYTERMKDDLYKNDAIVLLTMRPPLQVEMENEIIAYEKNAEDCYGPLPFQLSAYAYFIEFVKQYKKFPFSSAEDKDQFVKFIAESESRRKNAPKRDTLPKREYFEIILDRVIKTYQLGVKLLDISNLREIFQQAVKESERNFYFRLLKQLQGVEDKSPELFNILTKISCLRDNRFCLEKLGEHHQQEIVILPENEAKKQEVIPNNAGLFSVSMTNRNANESSEKNCEENNFRLFRKKI